MLVDGKWVETWQPIQKADEKGRFLRQVSSFRNWITPDGSAGPSGTGGFEAEAGVFETLDTLEARLTGDYLFGDRLTEADIRMHYHSNRTTQARLIKSAHPRSGASLSRMVLF